MPKPIRYKMRKNANQQLSSQQPTVLQKLLEPNRNTVYILQDYKIQHKSMLQNNHCLKDTKIITYNPQAIIGTCTCEIMKTTTIA